MSKLVHKLFLTRGVPGTHDIKMLNHVISNLKRKKFKTTLIPTFEKSKDDRRKKKNWLKVTKKTSNNYIRRMVRRCSRSKIRRFGKTN